MFLPSFLSTFDNGLVLFTLEGKSPLDATAKARLGSSWQLNARIRWRGREREERDVRGDVEEAQSTRCGGTIES